MNDELNTYLEETIIVIKGLTPARYPELQRETKRRCIQALEEIQGECCNDINQQTL